MRLRDVHRLVESLANRDSPLLRLDCRGSWLKKDELDEATQLLLPLTKELLIEKNVAGLVAHQLFDGIQEM